MFGLYKKHTPKSIVIGLGNPGNKYLYTRHNAGFLFLSAFADKIHCEIKKKQANAVTGYSEEYDVMLVKPLTYMNMSGVAVHALIKKYNINPQDMIVVHDDIDIPIGRVKFHYNRSSAGHKGIESIIQHIGTKEFYRIRIGIGKPVITGQTVEHVLSEFSPNELRLLESLFDKLSEGIQMFIKDERQKAMEFVNKIRIV